MSSIKKFDNFQPTIDTYIKKVGFIGENIMPELFGGKDADATIKLEPNAFSTYQVFNRLPSAKFIPKYVSNRLHASKIPTPVTVISPVSEIKTFSSRRKLNTDPIIKGSLYFKRPKFDNQYQITVYEGKVIGLRQIFEGKAIHLNLYRFPRMADVQEVATTLHEALKSPMLRFRLGTTNNSKVLLGMENFQLRKPELVKLYYNVYETHVGHMPAWFKHHIESSMIIPFLYEYANRDKYRELCPYVL